MTPDVVGTCGCGVRLVTHWRWINLPRPERGELRVAGYGPKNADGECDKCAHVRRYVRRPRAGYSRAEVLTEWGRFVDRRDTKARNIEALAPRLGMTQAALERALLRAGVKAWAS